MVELDPKSGKRKVLFEYPVHVLSEVTGSDIKDREGNLYFAGRKSIAGHDASAPFMIKFNPEKEIKK